MHFHWFFFFFHSKLFRTADIQKIRANELIARIDDNEKLMPDPYKGPYQLIRNKISLLEGSASQEDHLNVH